MDRGCRRRSAIIGAAQGEDARPAGAGTDGAHRLLRIEPRLAGQRTIRLGGSDVDPDRHQPGWRRTSCGCRCRRGRRRCRFPARKAAKRGAKARDLPAESPLAATTTVSFARACAPVPLIGQSSSADVPPRPNASWRAAASFSAREKVEHSMTATPRPSRRRRKGAERCPAGPVRVRQAGRQHRCSGGRPGGGAPPPARRLPRQRRRASGEMSKPWTCHPAAARWPAIAPPMMPRPITPTLRSSLRACHPPCCVGGAALSALPLLALPACAAHSRDRSATEAAGGDAMADIGIAGIGRMGRAIAERLLETGHRVRVWNRSAEKLAPLVAQGAEAAASPRALAEGSGVLLSILTDRAAIEAVYAGEDGILSADLTGRTVIEMSTVRPEVEEDLARRVRAAGGGFVGMSRRRHHGAGTAGAAYWPRRRGGGGHRRRPPGAGSAVPTHRTCRAGGGGGGAEARHQPAALGILSGLRRGADAVPTPRPRSGVAGGPVRRQFGRAECAEDSRRLYRSCPGGR